MNNTDLEAFLRQMCYDGQMDEDEIEEFVEVMMTKVIKPLQKQVEELKELPKQAFNDARLKSSQLPLQLLWKNYEEWEEQALK